jgi:hypothetical protein
MRRHNIVLWILLVFFTGGICSLVWLVRTKNDMNSVGQKIPTAWVLLIPFLGALWFHWKWSQGVENVTEGNSTTFGTFLLVLFLGFIGQAIVQSNLNKLAESA